jgi:hypothetical protein
LDRVPYFGRGSTFDGLNYSQKGYKMIVLERYKHLNKDSLSYLRDYPESIDLYQKYFSISEEKKKILTLF